jgi:hypothetical protein
MPAATWDSGVSISGLVSKVRLDSECASSISRRRNVNQTRRRIERHGRPVMRSIRRRRQRDGRFVLIVVRLRIHNRPACFRIDPFRPCDLRKRLG